MAEQKCALIIEIWEAGDGFELWFDGTQRDLLEIKGIAGAMPVPFEEREVGRWNVFTDPRYDTMEIALEVMRKFDTPIPDSFKDALEDTCE